MGAGVHRHSSWGRLIGFGLGLRDAKAIVVSRRLFDAAAHGRVMVPRTGAMVVVIAVPIEPTPLNVGDAA
ncbi:hypothetical protein AB0C34_21435 [Nocardia sp. NPDC049220]|uniref:hypothetical protein n=1 Tax=Nocardia sp. NPDC049220 TaxID=3155273 RepID=UPI0033F04B6A